MGLWTYKFDRFDNEVTIQQGMVGRATFKRYMYFEPSGYVDWAKGDLPTLRYSAELLNHPDLPAYQQHLNGSLSAFYMYKINGITNMNSQDNPVALSYGIVQLEYQNYRQQTSNNKSKDTSSTADAVYQTSGGTTSAVVRTPWNSRVADFVQTNFQKQTPWIEGYNDSGNACYIETTAHQPYDNLMTSRWCQKYTWTYATNNQPSQESYSLNNPIINNNTISLCGGRVNALSGTALLLPPTYKLMYYNDDKKLTSTPYYVWNFELQIDPYGQFEQIFNAGTKALNSNGQYDICTWYVSDPNSTNPIQKHYTDFSAMASALLAVNNYNKTAAELDKKTFTGDLTSNPVPLTSGGTIDYTAITTPSNKVINKFYKYPLIDFTSGIVGWR